MNTPLFIARKIIGPGAGRKNFSRSIVGLAIFGIALGLAVMIIAVAIVIGFKKEISAKVTGFGAHIQIVNLDSNSSYETQPVPTGLPEISVIREMKEVSHVQAFAIKAGIIKTDEQIQGAVLKGIDRDFDWSFIRENLIEGQLFTLSDSTRTNEVVLSKAIASLLNLKVGDSFNMYFIQDPPRARRFTISGIYRTSMEEFDKLFVFADIRHVQRLNNWTPEEISGYEVNVNDFRKIEPVTADIRNLLALKFLDDGSRLKVVPIQHKYPQIFDWLNLQDMNVVIIIILMLVVAGFNMISGLLILILERTNMIGILKALGAGNRMVRRVFLWQSGYLILRGLFWGNLIGIGLCLIQKYFQPISLDPTSYYLDTVPVHLSILNLLLLNAGTMVITMFFLLIPSMIISRIVPEKAIRFN
ncbi:MAG: ABC transporter permease [Bacteroidota bacterium]